MTDFLEALRAQFIDRCRADLARLEALPEDDDEVTSIVHRLAGAAGSFGFLQVSRIAAEIDLRTRNGIRPSGRELDDLKASLGKAIDRID
ncbi:MAG: Hpt domain-containing protein [Brevundimonas sp.]|nr:Hpt domain-containing protein [Brevundimonas sp.]